MAAKIEALTLNTTPLTRKRDLVASFAGAAREWRRRGQLGSSSMSEMRGYTGAR